MVGCSVQITHSVNKLCNYRENNTYKGDGWEKMAKVLQTYYVQFLYNKHWHIGHHMKDLD